MVFASLDEALQALEAGVVSLHSKIFCRISEPGDNGAEWTRRVETTPGRLLLFEILPKQSGGRLRAAAQPAADQARDHRGGRRGLPVLRSEGDRGVRRPADEPRLRLRRARRHLVRQGRHAGARDQGQAGQRHAGAGQAVRAAVRRRPDHQGREVQQGGRRLGAVHRSGGRRDDEGDPGHGRDPQPRDRPHQPAELDLHDGRFRRPRLGCPDQAAGRHARPDGQALGRDHRDADHLQLQGGAVGARVLQLDARRPQRPRRHGAQDRQLGLSDPASGRRRAGLHHRRGGLRHRPSRSRWRRSSRAAR